MTFAFPMFLPRPAGSAPPATFEDAVIALLGAKLRAFWLYDEPSHLWQDTSGTTAVTSDTDPVGRVDDLSGNGKHLLQATSGNKPVYRTGPSRMEWDGVNDRLEVATPAFPTDELEWFCVNGEISAIDSDISTFAPSNTGTGFLIGTGSGSYHLIVATQGGGLSVSVPGAGAAPLGLSQVTKAVATCSARRNNGTEVTDSDFTTLTSPHTGNFISGGNNGSRYNNCDKRLEIITAPLTTGERSDLRDLINARYSLW